MHVCFDTFFLKNHWNNSSIHQDSWHLFFPLNQLSDINCSGSALVIVTVRSQCFGAFSFYTQVHVSLKRATKRAWCCSTDNHSLPGSVNPRGAICSVNNSPPLGHLDRAGRCWTKQPHSPASYPAAPWQPQPLNMLCFSTSQRHLAEPRQRRSAVCLCGRRSSEALGLDPALFAHRSNGSHLDGGRWRRQVGAALVPHLATPHAPPPLPVWQEARPHLQGPAERSRELWEMGSLIGGLVTDPLQNIHVELCG